MQISLGQGFPTCGPQTPGGLQKVFKSKDRAHWGRPYPYVSLPFRVSAPLPEDVWLLWERHARQALSPRSLSIQGTGSKASRGARLLSLPPPHTRTHSRNSALAPYPPEVPPLRCWELALWLGRGQRGSGAEEAVRANSSQWDLRSSVPCGLHVPRPTLTLTSPLGSVTLHLLSFLNTSPRSNG